MPLSQGSPEPEQPSTTSVLVSGSNLSIIWNDLPSNKHKKLFIIVIIADMLAKPQF